MVKGLLAAGDPAPVRVTGDRLAPGPFVLLGDHAGRAIPAGLGTLGLPSAELTRHIALDLGVEELGLALAERLGAPFLRQTYSRLVIDCNRDPAHAQAIAETSDGTPISGNRGLGAEARRARVAAVFEPYHAAIADALNAREAAGLETVVVSLHSFTPVMDGFDRPWEIGVLHDGRRDDFALAVLTRLQAEPAWVAAGNVPYAMDETDYTVPRHAYRRGLRYIELEVRQDLIGPRVAEIAALLAGAFRACA